MKNSKDSFDFDGLLHTTWSDAEAGKVAVNSKDELVYAKDARSRIASAAANAKDIDKKVPFLKRASQQGELLENRWKQLDGGQKVNAGMWGAGAVLGAFGTVSAIRYSAARDENGKAHIVWSQVGVALLQAAMAAGCAYMGVQAVHGRA